MKGVGPGLSSDGSQGSTLTDKGPILPSEWTHRHDGKLPHTLSLSHVLSRRHEVVDRTRRVGRGDPIDLGKDDGDRQLIWDLGVASEESETVAGPGTVPERRPGTGEEGHDR